MTEQQNLLPAESPLDSGQYEVFRASAQDIENLLSELQGISVQDLDRVKIPSGGSLFFEVPGTDGPAPTKSLTGIILAKSEQRVMWITKLSDRDGGGAKPPDCSSKDSFVGHGKRWDDDDETSAHDCLTCPLAKYPGNCKPVLLVFLLQRESLLPLVLVLPRMSIKETKQYLLRLTAKKISGMALETEFVLEKAKSQEGIEYARAVPRSGRRLTGSEIQSLGQLAAGLKRVFGGVRVRQEDVSDSS